MIKRLFICFVPLAICCSLIFAKHASGEFIITCFEMKDIGRGAGLAVLLQTPNGHAYLYDTGIGYPSKTDPSGWVGNFNAGRDVIAPFLRKNNIHAIDGVVISHAHLDHYGGLLWLVDHFPIRKLYDGGYEFHGPLPPDWQSELGGYSQLRNRFRQRPGGYQEVHTGDKLNWDPSLDVEVLAPPRHYFGEPHPEKRSPKDPPAHYLVNANSTDVRIRHGNIVFLFPGDIEKEDQVQSLLKSVPREKFKCDILIAPGHGINSCQSPEFAEATRPKVVIASLLARWLKGNRSPALYGKFGGKVYFTAVEGQIRVVSDGVHYRVRTERGAKSL